MAPLRYSHAVVARVPHAFKELKDGTGDLIADIDAARKQHECLVRILRDLGLDVIELPPDEALPRSVFVENSAVVVNGLALMTRPADSNRTKEVDSVRAVLKKELGLPIFEVTEKNAHLEGGDVLFTGEEFFVGLSDYTNEAGARAVANTFPEYPCAPIKVPAKRQLKSYITMAGPELLCVSSGSDSQLVLKRIEREATFSYHTLTVPEDCAANVVFCNGTLIHRSSEDIPLSAKVFSERIDYNRKGISFGELSKLSNGLSSCVLLLPRTRHIRSL